MVRICLKKFVKLREGPDMKILCCLILPQILVE